ncbi:MAG: acyltransferase family protein [Peptoniphilaceae bacterium]|nr:acyltransferase family protein [Peptoniphilaceae bacterium]MDY6018700.1 acyltransferase family protein [Anaerococcus sp.]
MLENRKRRKRNFNYITILRGIATLGVTFFHLFPQRIKGGFLGVVMFFLMSGFLMTRNLDRRDSIDSLEKLKANLLSRFNKLLPALYTIMVIGLIASFIFAKAIFTDSIKSALPVAFGYQNIYQIVSGGSYFQRNGNFSIFTHLWYIALQIQYILIFYILNYFIDKNNLKKYRKTVFAALTIVSFASMYILALKKASITRIYYGPDTRMSALFLGGFLYLESEKFESIIKKLTAKTKKITIGLLLLLSVIPFFFIEGESYLTYRLFMVFYTILVGFLVLSLYLYEKNLIIERNHRTRIGLIGSIFYYLGSRSYHIYLWQYMIQIFFAYGLAFKTGSKLAFFLLELLLILVLSELTFNIFKRKIKSKIVMAVAIFLMCLMVFASNFIKDSKDQDINNLEKTINKNKAQIEADNKKALEATKNKKKDSKKTDTKKSEQATSEDKEDKGIAKEVKGQKDKYDFDFTQKELAYLKNLSVTAVGDSIIININSYLREYIPNLYLDGEVGRDMPAAPDVLTAIKNNQGLGDIILIALGSNGKLEADDFDQIMEVAGNREVLFVNTSHTQPWQDYINDQIEKFCEKTDNAYLVDWYSYPKGKKELFAQDLVHPNVEGSQAYANIVARAILNTNHASENK